MTAPTLTDDPWTGEEPTEEVADELVAADPVAPPADPLAPPAGAGRSPADTAALIGMAVGLWVAIVFLGRLWGLLLEAQGHDMILYTPPFLGSYRDVRTVSLLLPVPFGVLLIAGLPVLARRLPWRLACLTGVLACLAWGVLLAVIDGNNGLISGLEWEREYQPFVDAVTQGPGRWLSDFIDLVPHAGVQVRAHPPGLVLLLGAMSGLGLGGPWWAAALVLGVAVSAVAAVLVVVRELVDEDTARRAMPFVALVPGVVFVFTSFDALYMGVGAWFITALVLAMGRTGRASTIWAVVAGVLAAAAVLGSYGMVLLGCVALFEAVRLRCWRPVLIAAGTALGCILAFVPFGYWWLSGLGATREAYYALDLDRPYPYFLLADFSAVALVVGPAVAAGLALTRDRRLWLVLGGALLAMAVADLSGLSTGEVERIWLPFAIWLLPAAAVLAGRDRWTRVWLAVQAACPLVLLAFIRPLW